MDRDTWQVQIGAELSKKYTLDQLRRKHSSGVVSGEMPCTADKGRTFVPLQSVLSNVDDAQIHDCSETASTRGETRRPKRARPQRTNEARTEMPSSEAANQPSKSVNAIYERPAVPSQPSSDLNDLIAKASQAAIQEPENIDGPVSETYSIPEPPQAARFTLPDSATVDDMPRSAVAEAAAAALGHYEETPTEGIPRQSPSQPQATSESASVEDDDIELPVAARRSVLPRTFVALTVLGGIVAVGLLIWWRSVPEASSALSEIIGSASVFESTTGESATLEDLSARTQILGRQVATIARALQSRDDSAQSIGLLLTETESRAVKMPLVPFASRQLTETEQALVDGHLNRIAVMVNQGTQDGWNHDEATVKAHSRYLEELVAHVDSRGEDRTAVLHELGEFVKIAYLLNLGRIRAGDRDRQNSARSSLSGVGDIGLAAIYPEFAAGDVRFADLFARSDEATRARLVLVRYWYHRAGNRRTADEWRATAIEDVEQVHRDYVTDSIRQIDEIEAKL